MNRVLRFVTVLAVATLLTSVLPSAFVSAGEQGGQLLPLPLRLSAFAVNMSNVGTGRANVIDIRITRWTTPKEREELLTMMVEKGSDALMRSLLKLPDHGRLRIPGHTGPDPHKVVLGWGLHYAWNVPDGDGGQRIVVATDRYISMWEARNNPRTMDYPFTLLEIRLDKSGEGVGKASVATKISFNRKTNTMELENYGSEPVRLTTVKIEK